MAPAMFVPWRADWTSEKTGIHPPFKCSHTRSHFTPTAEQPVSKYAISHGRFGNLAMKVLGGKLLRKIHIAYRRLLILLHNMLGTYYLSDEAI